MKSTKFSPWYMFMCLVLLFIIGCNKPTSPPDARVYGTVSLENSNNHDGIVVRLYSCLSVNEQIAGIYSDYPNTGFSPKTEQFFDPRLQPILYETSTNNNGYFEIDEVIAGEYIVVCLKEGWGLAQLFNLSVSGHDVDITSQVDVLPAIVIVDQVVSDQIVFEEGGWYRFMNDTIILPDTMVEFQRGCNLLIDPGKSLVIHGNVVINDNTSGMIRVTTTDHLYDQSPTLLPFIKMQISSSASCPVLTDFTVSNSVEGMIINSSSTVCQRSLFINSHYALQLNNTSNAEVSNCIFMNNGMNQNESMSINSCSQVDVKNNIFLDNYIAVLVSTAVNVLFMDNYVTGGHQQFVSTMESDIVVQNNIFTGSEIAISNTGMSNLLVKFNEISASTCIRTYHTTNMYNTMSMGWTKAVSNNFSALNVVVDSRAMYYYQNDWTPYPLDFSNNFWGTQVQAEIENMIYDYYDSPPPHMPSACWGVINYQPFNSARLSNAGIQHK